MSGDATRPVKSDLSLSVGLLADNVRQSSERFTDGIPWAWMLELLMAATGGDAGVMLDPEEAPSARRKEVAGEVADEELAALVLGEPPGEAWLRVPFAHAGRTEAVAWLRNGATHGDLPRWVGLVRPFWAAMIAARRSEERRRAMEASYRELFHGAADALFVADASLRYIDVNDRACEALGYTRDELTSMTVRDLVPADEQAERPLDIASLDRGATVHSARPMRCKDGSSRWFDLATRRLPDGRYIAIARDIQEQREASLRLQRSEESFRTLIEGSPDGIIIHRAGVIVYANPAALSMLGYHRDEGLAGRSVLSIMHPDDYEVAFARIRAMTTGMASVPPVEERLVRADGTIMHAEVTAMRTVFQGEPAIVAIGRDRSEARRMRAELAHADRVATVGRLAAGVAHEINNPLTYVTLHLGTVAAAVAGVQRGDLAASPDTCRAISESLRTATQGLERVRRIVRDLKTFSRQDDDRGELVDLQATIESALNLASHELKHRANVVRDFAPIPKVRGIEGRLCQVFLNLLVNAAQAIPEDESPHEVCVRTRVDGASVRVDVIDDGRGMSASVRARVFEPFFTTKRAGDGTGLGLSISADIIAAHGGRIEVQSEEGRGSTFSVILPAATEALGDAPARAATLPARRSRVLVIDDEPAVLASVARALSDEHAVITAGSSADALRIIERDPSFDLVLCDVVMPGMGGVELIAILAQRWPALAPKVLLMAGGPSGDAALRSAAGRRVLAKPFDAQTLRDTIAAALLDARDLAAEPTRARG